MTTIIFSVVSFIIGFVVSPFVLIFIFKHEGEYDPERPRRYIFGPITKKSSKDK